MTLRDRPLLYTISQPELEVRDSGAARALRGLRLRARHPAPGGELPGRQPPAPLRLGEGGGRSPRFPPRASPTSSLPASSASRGERRGKLYAAFNHMGAPRLSIIEMEALPGREGDPLWWDRATSRAPTPAPPTSGSTPTASRSSSSTRTPSSPWSAPCGPRRARRPCTSSSPPTAPAPS